MTFPAWNSLGESAYASDPDIAIKKVPATARLMDAFSRSALTLQRLESGSGRTLQVQFMQVNATVRGCFRMSAKLVGLCSCK